MVCEWDCVRSRDDERDDVGDEVSVWTRDKVGIECETSCEYEVEPVLDDEAVSVCGSRDEVLVSEIEIVDDVEGDVEGDKDGVTDVEGFGLVSDCVSDRILL